MARIIDTPSTREADFSRAGARSFWKHILPERAINYRGRDGKQRVIDFNSSYHDDLKAAFSSKALTQTPFVLADADNAHTMDPERFRGEVSALAKAEELPEKVRRDLEAKHGSVPKGLYAKIEFATKKAARAVMENGKLPVSARIREGFERSDGKEFPRALVHVLGTMDPKIPDLAPWTPAVDLSEYAHDDVLDLSHESYTEARKMPKQKKSKKSDVDLATATVVPDIDEVTADDIAEWDDATLTAFLDQYASDQDDDGDDDADDDNDEDEDDEMGNRSQDIELANARAAEADRRSRAALDRAAKIEWGATRKELLRDGVPPHVLDLAEPVLARANDLVIDLSNSEEDDLDVTSIIRDLVDGYKGTIDLSEIELGHGGQDGQNKGNPDQELADRFAEITADL